MRQFLMGWLVALAGIGAGVLAMPTLAATPAGVPVDEVTRQVVVERLDRMPLLFVQEQVSDDAKTAYVVRGRLASVWLGELGMSYRLHPTDATDATAGSWVVALDLVGAAPRQPFGEDLLPTRVSHFKGARDQSRTDQPTYGSVVYREPWPGVDLVVGGSAGKLKSSFFVRPGADPGTIRLAYRGASTVRLGADGSLIVDTPMGEIREEAPFAYQEVDGRRVEVQAAFEVEKESESGHYTYRFRLGEYDLGRELVVDPVTLVYCGYIGGFGREQASDIAVSATGEAYIVGQTASTEASFPVTVGPDLTYNGGLWDVFVAKVNAAGTALEYCGYIGGVGNDYGNGIAVDAAGSAYIVGNTESTEATFPVTVGPDLTYNGGGMDAFVAKVNAAGTALEYCGYIGGSGWEVGNGIAVDAVGDAYVTGETPSTEATFPVTVGPDLTFNGLNDVYVAKVNVDGSGLEYCGYIGGTAVEGGNGIAIDNTGRVVVTGHTNSTEDTFPLTIGPDLSYNGGQYDAFVARVNAAGTALEYCGYIGGSGHESGYGIAVDTAGRAYIGGFTPSTETTFPVTVGPDLTHNGSNDAFVARVNADGTALDRCGYIGGSGYDSVGDLTLDSAGNVHVVGLTSSDENTFPVADGPDLTYNGGEDDVFVAGVNSTFSALLYCGYIGGSGDEASVGGVAVGGVAVDPAGNVYVGGLTYSDEVTFPVTLGPDLTFNGDRDAFVAKLILFMFADGFETGDTLAWSNTVP